MTTDSTALPDAYIETALSALDAARTVTSRYFRASLEMDIKADQSPVTLADRETERAIREIILNNHPDHGFFGEESGDQTNEEEWRWIIDPIDGTKSFTTGKPTFGTLIALLHEDTPVLGLIDHGALGERWVGQRGRRTLFNGKPCSASTRSSIAHATLCATTVDMFDTDGWNRFQQLSNSCQFRAFGGDCHSYGLLASGFTDLVCEADLKPYDYLALVPVVEGAGGKISDWCGKPLGLDSGDRVLASANPVLHEAALAVLQQAG